MRQLMLGGVSSTRTASCPQCGAAVEIPQDRAADTCSFCETPLVIEAGEGEPAESFDRVVPFGIPRERAGSLLKTFLAADIWAPEAVRRAARPERIHGVFVPFYLYDGVARSQYRAEVGLHWYRTEHYTVVVNGRVQHRTRQVQETEWFTVDGAHVATYTRQLVSGSRGLPEAEANQLEPFDLGRALPYSDALTAGWIAERPNVTHEEAAATVAREVAASENTVIQRSFVPGDRVRNVTNQTQLTIGKVDLALLPVWIATWTFDGKVLRLLVNGQTGEVVGKLPRSNWKIAGAVSIVVLLVLMVVGDMGLIGTVLALFRGRR